VNWIRSFSDQGGTSGTRSLEDAPLPMRQELVDLFFSLAEHNHDDIPPEHVYQVILQSLGAQPSSGLPYSYRSLAAREVRGVDWPRVYDLIGRLWPDFDRPGFGSLFREGVNRILAAHRVAWDLDEQGDLCRVLPLAAHSQVTDAFEELNNPEYEPALTLFNAARHAYDDRPRRDRDTCTNIFDCLESVAKIKYGRPNDTFGQVKNLVNQNDQQRGQVIAMFTALNNLRNQHFGHGMTQDFSLTGAEVDFIYLTCIGAILLLTRTP